MSPKNWESAVDQQIREAQELGKFDNLPGRGKPLDLKPNPYAQDRCAWRDRGRRSHPLGAG